MSEAPRPVNRSGEELAMRALCVARLRASYPGARVIHELPTHFSENRIDLAAVSATQIIAVEIKSSVDVADRLEAQLRAFQPIAHKLIVALAPRWIADPDYEVIETTPGTRWHKPIRTPAQEAIHRVKGDTVIWSVDAASTAVKVIGYDAGDARLSIPWPAKMLGILHRSELLEISSRRRVYNASRRATRSFLIDVCARMMSGSEVEADVCAALRARRAFAAESDAPIGAAPRPSLPSTLFRKPEKAAAR